MLSASYYLASAASDGILYYHASQVCMAVRLPTYTWCCCLVPSCQLMSQRRYSPLCVQFSAQGKASVVLAVA